MTVSILVILAGILLLGSVAARRQALVKSGAQEVAGFLREAVSFALNGVKAPQCDLADQANERLCSQYVVTLGVGGNPAAYAREASGQGDVPVVRTLPRGARFGRPPSLGTQALTFRYTPPTLTTTPAAVEITTAGGSPTWWVCVGTIGSVDVRKGTC